MIRSTEEVMHGNGHATSDSVAVGPEIISRLKDGEDIAAVSEACGVTQANLRKAFNTSRFEAIQNSPFLKFIDSPEFHTEDAERILQESMPTSSYEHAAKPPPGLPAYLSALYETPLLTREQEQDLFRKYNYLKFLASELTQTLDSKNPETTTMSTIEALLISAEEVRDRLIKANLRLVVSIMKKKLIPGQEILELVSGGNQSLMRSVEKFDYSRGNRFSTYATWAIVKNHNREQGNDRAKQKRFQNRGNEFLDEFEDVRVKSSETESDQNEKMIALGKALNSSNALDDREKRIIELRYGLNGEEALTLKGVGEAVGLTKERARQIAVRALRKLKKVLSDM